MAIQADRILRDIEVIAGFSEVGPEIGYSRPTFSETWRKARDYVEAEARKAGCTVRVDAAGNVHARPAQYTWNQDLWLSGSHIDSVPTGGKYDGVVGVVAALEVLRAHASAPLELIIFAEEEGTTFNLGMLGSRAWVGSLDAAGMAQLKNRDGVDYLTAGAAHGLETEKLVRDRIRPGQYRGLIEVHIEQGPAMWNSGTPVAVVTAINGRRQYAVTVTGSPNHAGSTKMSDRRDALAGAAEMIAGLEKLARELDAETDHTVITVGRLNVQPNALNVIAGEVMFYIDFRARADATLHAGEGKLRQLVTEIAAWRKLGIDIRTTESLPAIALDTGVCQRLHAAGKRLGLNLPNVASGALHDAAILAPVVPTSMLFVASEGGISHNRAEFSRLEDIVLATRVLAEAVAE